MMIKNYQAFGGVKFTEGTTVGRKILGSDVGK